MQLDTELWYTHAQPGMMDMNIPLLRQCTEPPGLSSTMERTKLRGWGTRLFEVHRLKDNIEVGELIMIKDIWVDDD